MAPPQASKTSRHSFSYQRASRQTGPVTSDNHEASDFDNSSAMSSSGMPRDEPEHSQGISMETLMSKMVNTHRKRHAINKQNIITSYNTSSKELENAVNGSFDEHEENASAAHEAQLKRLHDLLAIKANIEADMASKLADLKASYDAHSRDLESVIAHRVKELK